jgi:hypothetical protein
MNSRRFSAISIAATVALATVATFPARALSPSAGAATPTPRASQFSARVDNPWYPLKPGTVYTYRGVKDGRPSREVLTVTHETKTIDGAACVVIQDRLYVDGHLGERTTDWYSQDKQGNVWYFGEETAELDENGHVTTTAGSWRAGVKGARAGIFMFARPRVGRSARQEFYRGQAEDHFQVLSLHASVKVPYVSSKQALLTKEWTPLEPGTVDHKLYVRGVGTVLEQTVRGGNERAALVSVRTSR